jgi:hypothetical protein
MRTTTSDVSRNSTDKFERLVVAGGPVKNFAYRTRPHAAGEPLRRAYSTLDTGVDRFEATSARRADVGVRSFHRVFQQILATVWRSLPHGPPLAEDLEKWESGRGVGTTVWQRAGQGIPAVREAITRQRS